MADPDRWVEVATFASRGAAEAVVTLLSSEGIPARVIDVEGMGLSDHTGMGLAAVRVRERDRDRAREVLGSVSDADLEAEALAASPGTTRRGTADLGRPAARPGRAVLRGRARSVLLALAVAAMTAALVARSCGG
ncbi:MAG TPA: DUF2007 domain-containing protein [Anaeromyxobacteraceae bacterium]|nr:DUF2007 domain-containing protein [Anaeromyxobacteraceae bacterium]